MKTHTCISCGNKFTGHFCNNCGEKVIRKEDKKLKHFLGEFISAITFADSKLWRTIKYILVKPGKFSRDFVDGKRIIYMKPISIFFLANLIYFLFPIFSTFNTPLQVQIRPTNFIHSKVANRMVEERLEEQEITLEEYEILYDAKTSELSKLLLILMAILLAISFYVIHDKKNFLADHLVVSLELMTFIILFAIQIQGILMYAIHYLGLLSSSYEYNEVLVSTIVFFLVFYFLFRMEINFYKVNTWRAFLNSFLCIVSFTAVLFLYRAILFFITYWVV